MARYKEFNQEEVLEKAMKTFWRYGYEGTSIQNLVDNMGISRGSLYDTFGDKRSLFQKAIAHYDRTVIRQLILPLEAEAASKNAIFDCFDSLINRAVSDRDRKGCFLTNTVVELCPHDSETASQIAQNIKRVEKAFHKALIKAKDRGEIKADLDLEALASFLTSSLQGLRVISKIHCDRQMLADIVKVTLSVLD
ncbi:MAG: TetR/AcrR family transcriptional regulator [Prochloraceae cyanobacterium]|nr:TetR/AcrR family transcriptional regulator [Prochloraceae cyanobacterium]